MNPRELPRFLITDVYNYGGFFGGDTVTLEARRLEDADGERTLVIDEKALENVRGRHNIIKGMVLALHMDGERVDHAWLLAAEQHEDLRAALGPAEVRGALEGPLVLSSRCPGCERWSPTALQEGGSCPACGAAISVSV